MNNNVKIIFTFALGAAVGVVASQRFFKKKYEAIAQEEIDSVKEVYSKKEEILAKTLFDEDTVDATEEEVNEYTDMINNLGYTKNEEKGGSEPMNKNMIEVIPPDEFGDNDEYDLISITYYANKILTDDGDYPIDDPESIVGTEALNSFGEYEQDAVYVRNDERKCYYEILRDNSDYSGPSGWDE